MYQSSLRICSTLENIRKWPENPGKGLEIKRNESDSERGKGIR